MKIASTDDISATGARYFIIGEQVPSSGTRARLSGHIINYYSSSGNTNRRVPLLPLMSMSL